MTEMSHQIKKYVNGRLYDVTGKKYITMGDLENFVRTGVSFTVVMSKTDEDITDSVIEKIKKEMEPKFGKKPKNKLKVKPKLKPKVGPKIQAKQKIEPKIASEAKPDETKDIFSRLLLKGSGMFAGYAREYADLWHSAISMAEGEFDKRVKQLVSAKELSKTEAGEVKKEVFGMVRSLKNWVGANLEERIYNIISTMNLATRSQVEELTEKINDLNIKLTMLERMEKEREDSPEGLSVETEK
jgi:polyhydroxyalkanoate synthesis regulator phasin